MSADDLGPGPTVLLDVLTAFRDLLREHEDEINALNVFPVADGDTGTNVLLTVEAALGLVGTAQPGRPAPDFVALCDQLSRGALLGARGSSGVIASQALVAALDSLARAGRLDSASVAAALADARDAAYTAVAHPVEGTILTVLSAAAAAARTASDLRLPDLTELLALEAWDAVVRTPSLLPELAAAGVVDSGGRALSLGFDALAQVLGGQPSPPARVIRVATRTVADRPPGTEGAAHATRELDGSGRYEVVATLHTDQDHAGRVRARWQEIGDTVVVAGVGDLWRAHVHTDSPDTALAAARAEAGEHQVDDVTLTDLQAQIAERAVAAVQEPDRASAEAGGNPPRRVGLVAVAQGPGLARAFRELGAQVVEVDAAAPSVQDLLAAIEQCAADDVILLPNDADVLPAAARAQELSTARVHVVSTEDPLAGLAAAVVHQPSGRPTDAVQAMTEAASRVRAGRVAKVVREAVLTVGPVHPGQWLALTGKRAVAVGEDPFQVAVRLAEQLASPRTEVLTIAHGRAASDGAAENLLRRLRSEYPEAVVEVLDGGSRDAFLLSAEDGPDEPDDSSTDPDRTSAKEDMS